MKRLAAAALVAGGMLAASVSTASAATYSITELAPVDPTGTLSWAYDINDAGQAVGISSKTPNPTTAGNNRPTKWNSSGTPTELSGGENPTSYARSINNSGQIAGDLNVEETLDSSIPGGLGDNNRLATRWESDLTPTTLDTPAGGIWSTGQDINNSGQVAGYFSTTIDASELKAARWEADGSPTDLSTGLPPADPVSNAGGNVSSVALGINDAGEVVGWNTSSGFSRPTMWDADGNAIELPSIGGALASQGVANAINNNGQIVGRAKQTLMTITQPFGKTVRR